MVGFFCNGEISHNRVYGYTGVLSLSCETRLTKGAANP